MSRMTADDLVPVKEYRDALPRSESAVVDGLKKMIDEDGECLMPILYHMDDLGAPCIVDGYTRYDIWKSSNDEVSTPRCKEVISLSGSTQEEVVEWIRKHQAFRRNNEKLILQYAIGKQTQSKGAKETAETFQVTQSQAYHAKDFAEAVDKLDDIEPGLKDKAIDNAVPAKSIKDAAKKNDPAPVHEAVESGGVKRSRPKGPLAHFKKLNTLSGQMNRALVALTNETGTNSWSDKLEELLREVGSQIQEWEDAEVMGQ